MGWIVWDLNPGGGEFLCTIQTGPVTHPACCTMGIGFFLGVKRQDHSIHHSPLSNTKVVNEYSCTYNPSYAFMVYNGIALPVSSQNHGTRVH